MSPTDGLRVAICDDSRTYTHALKRFLERDGDIAVVATYASAEQLLERLPIDQPQLVTMDVELPGINGVEATRRIMSGSRPVPIVVLSAHVSPGSELAAAALAGGAVDALLKGEFRLTDIDGRDAVAWRRRFKHLARARVRPVPRSRPAAPVRPRARRRTPRTAAPVRAIGIAASTGGPQALALILAALPAGFPIPVLVVQHMAVGFTGGLASWLDRQVPLPVRVAEPRREATPGIWFAAEGTNLVVDSGLVLGEDNRTKTSVHRPAADVLFASMAAALGDAAATVVLTGLGRDGAAGTGAVVAAGGIAFAQDAATSVVNGMPAAAVAAGAHQVLALEDIAGALRMLRPAA